MNEKQTHIPLRLLVVEDEALLAEEVKDRLIRNGYHVVGIADTADKAIEAAGRLGPDLILMDIRLKGASDGIQAACQIHEHLGIPAIFLTAHSDRATLERARKPAQFGYLLKPIREPDLLAAIEMAVHRHGIGRKLRASQFSDAAIFESSADAIVGSDREGLIWRWNPAAQSLFGYGGAEVMGRHIGILTPPGLEQDRASVLKKIQSGDLIQAHETVRMRKDRSLVDVSLSVAPLKDLGGSVVGAVGILREISEGKKAEERLRRSEARLEAVVEEMPVLLVAFGKSGELLLWNRECERVTGYSAAEMVGNPLATSLLYPDEEYRERMLTDMRSHGDHNRAQAWTLTCKDSSLRTIAWSSISRLFPIDGWASWAVGLDATERLQLEEDLRQARKMQALGLLAGGVAHDFNNLLTVINGYAAMVHSKLSGQPDLQQRVNQIAKAGKAAAAITDQLLAFSQKRVADLKAVDLNRTISAFRPILEPLIGPGITLKLDLRPNQRAVLATESSVETILLNLAANARDAMPQGGELFIGTHSTVASKPGGDVGSARLCNVLTVRDSGGGIPPDIKGRIFDPFFTTKPTGHGTGLGLATVYGIVSQRGGWIRVESHPSEGATFEVYLPATAGLDPQAGREQVSPAAPAGRRCCLVIDDNPAVRELVADFLRSYPLTVLEASDGPSALDIGRNHNGPIDLIVSDIVMPGMSGVEVVDKLRKDRPDVCVLFTTGYAPDVTNTSAGDTLLAKPFSAEQLTAAVTAALARKRNQ